MRRSTRRDRRRDSQLPGHEEEVPAVGDLPATGDDRTRRMSGRAGGSGYNAGHASTRSGAPPSNGASKAAYSSESLSMLKSPQNTADGGRAMRAYGPVSSAYGGVAGLRRDFGVQLAQALDLRPAVNGRSGTPGASSPPARGHPASAPSLPWPDAACVSPRMSPVAAEGAERRSAAAASTAPGCRTGTSAPRRSPPVRRRRRFTAACPGHRSRSVSNWSSRTLSTPSPEPPEPRLSTSCRQITSASARVRMVRAIRARSTRPSTPRPAWMFQLRIVVT